MTEPALLFVHSPLVGPLTWRPVAERCEAAGWSTAVADLTGAMTGPGPYQPAIATAVAGTAAGLDRPAVLIGHSGAGPLLPGVAAELDTQVRALVYVDAGLPYPGRSWFQTAPTELTAHLTGLASDGWLPPWHEWFEPEVVASVLPEPQLRSAFVAELVRLPLAYFQEPLPAATWPGPARYLLLSEAYRDDATRAVEQGIPVSEHPSHHLAMLTDPDDVTAALQDLLIALPPVR